MNYSTRNVIEHRYTVPLNPSPGEANSHTRWAREMCEKLGRPYSVKELDFDFDDEGRTVLVIREVRND